VLFARAGTPSDIVGKLHGEMARIMAAPDMREKIATLGLIPHESPSVAGIEQYIRSENDKWGGLVRQLGLQGSQ
jgi:tripartite-type tricarboxylate transporter receptor subunit TctC